MTEPTDVRELRERLEKLDRERAEWVEAWDMMRDTILNDYGPLEIDEILSTIDYHDPRTATPVPAPQQGGSVDPETPPCVDFHRKTPNV